MLPALDWQAQAAINSIAFGIGDDCALLQPAPGMQLAISTDMLVEGRHFRRDWSHPAEIGRKAITQNFADVEAMGARPIAVARARKGS